MTIMFTQEDLVEIERAFLHTVAKRIRTGRFNTTTGNVAWVFGIQRPILGGDGHFTGHEFSVGPDPAEKIENAYCKGNLVVRTGLSSGVVVEQFPELLQGGDFAWRGGVLVGVDLISAVSGGSPLEDEVLATDLGELANGLRRFTARMAIATSSTGEGHGRFIKLKPQVPGVVVTVKETPQGRITVRNLPTVPERIRLEALVQ